VCVSEIETELLWVFACENDTELLWVFMCVCV